MPKEQPIARLVIRGAADMTENQAADIMQWLAQQRASFMTSRDEYAKLFTATYGTYRLKKRAK